MAFLLESKLNAFFVIFLSDLGKVSCAEVNGASVSHN